MVQSSFGGKEKQDLMLDIFSQNPFPFDSLPSEAEWGSGDLLKVVSAFLTSKKQPLLWFVTSACYFKRGGGVHER